MFFTLSQLLDFFVTPSSMLVFLPLLGLLLLALRRRRIGYTLVWGAFVLLAAGAFLPLGPNALAMLENRFPQPRLDSDPTGLILLGGAVDIHISGEHKAIALNEAGERLTAFTGLALKYPSARLVVSGGAGHSADQWTSRSESDWAVDALVSMGVPRSRFEIDNTSRNTCENAVESKRIAGDLPSQQWLLVTSASHMPRAVACFRAVGFAVVPYPVDYRTLSTGWLHPPASASIGLSMLDLAAHEWVGLLTYRLSGMTTELFPSP
ncbi:MAG: YdcF family protein [Pseudomonas sp.]